MDVEFNLIQWSIQMNIILLRQSEFLEIFIFQFIGIQLGINKNMVWMDLHCYNIILIHSQSFKNLIPVILQRFSFPSIVDMNTFI